jgi:hypothetical protein
MKITKTLLKQIIKEELSTFGEAAGGDYSDNPYMAPAKQSSEAFSSLEQGKIYKMEGISKETGKKKSFDNILFWFQARSAARVSPFKFYFKQGDKEFSGTEKEIHSKLGLTPGSIKFIPKESSAAA